MYEKIKTIVASMEDDNKKFEAGNKSAGSRLRKSLQELKAAAQEFRVDILAKQKESK